MKLFLDTASTIDIASAFDTGLIDGVTTNPTLIKKAGARPDDIYREIAEIGVQDISMEVMGEYEDMLYEGYRLSGEFGDVATIKLPMTVDGLLACKELSKQQIRTNVTLIFNAAQALLAAKAGATYVSPFVGRIDDQGYAGLEVVRSIANLFCSMGCGTQVLAASIRTPHRAVRSFYNGAALATIPPSVFWKMYDHVLTDQGLDIFERDARK